MLLKILVCAQMAFISSQSWAWEFGSRGQNGDNGYSGRSGAWGQDVTVQSTGQILNLNLSGRDGEDGRDGRDGGDATNCQQPYYVEYNLEGARGGYGGDAGEGGAGGRGGNITVYTNNLANLSKITVYSEGGRGGRAGRSGNYGRGCRCTQYQWRIRKCSKDSNGKGTCYENTYYCNDGQDGRPGASRSDGNYGGRGSLTLIPTLNPLPPENKAAEVSVANILTTQVQLHSHVWQEKGGAIQLFAPGSVLTDQYVQFVGTRGFAYSFGWNARRPYTDFSRAKFYLAANQDGVSSSASRELWYDSDIQRNGDNYKEIVTRAMWGVEATKLTLEFSGEKAAFASTLTDQAKVSDMLKTSFHVVLKKIRPIIWDKTLFEGDVPSAQVIEGNNQFVVRLGQLPGVDTSDLEAGDKVSLNLHVQRVFGGGYADSQNIELKYQINK